ncbi:MAG: dTDP-4-dehydrorhamnose 3,5-epimerase family protein [Nitrospira sp.]|nr:dTDP-4-dehydrorhamnose 3,5-epimerase family protein [Nitrospira sp.]
MNRRLHVRHSAIRHVAVVERTVVSDSRGCFARLFCEQELLAIGWNKPIAQVNYSYTAKRGTIRGLHFQHPPAGEMKLVSCIRGRVWDVAVDVRAGSPTFLQWHAEELSEDNGRALLIPEGFAHGFQTLSDDVELIYCHSAQYAPQHEGGLWPFDPRLAVAWPMRHTDISDRDAAFTQIGQNFQGVAW